MDILEKKMKWATLKEDEVRKFEIFINDVFLDAIGDVPDPPMDEEEAALKEMICELEIELADLHDEINYPEEAMNSVLEEIYKMPGSIFQLKNLLDSQDDLIFHEKELIMRRWYDQKDLGCRELKSSEPLDDSKSSEFLREKAADIAKHREELLQIVPRLEKVDEMLESAKSALYSIQRRSTDRTQGSSKYRETYRRNFFTERGKILRAENKNPSSSE